MSGGGGSLLDEVLAANRAFLDGEPAPRPQALGARGLLALFCSDPRLTAILPRATGLGPEEVIAVRNAGGRADESACRSIALALVLGRATEVFVFGHTACPLCQATVMDLQQGMAARGVPRSALGGGDLREWFGVGAGERSSAVAAARAVLACPALPPGTRVHALLIDTRSGAIEALERGAGGAAEPRRPRRPLRRRLRRTARPRNRRPPWRTCPRRPRWRSPAAPPHSSGTSRSADPAAVTLHFGFRPPSRTLY